MQAQDVDVVCLQEIRAQAAHLEHPRFMPDGYHCSYQPAERKGYSGVGLLSRREPERIIRKLGSEEFEGEGRYLEAQFGKLSVVSLYMPSGSSSEERQQAKFRFMDHFKPHLDALKRKRRSYIICGDWNIAHKKIDLKNWRANQKHSGFLPEERAWMDRVLGEAGYVDAFRVVNQEADQYTWWSNRGRAWEKNVGWRIDYQIVSPDLAGSVRSAAIYKAQRFSDHAPLTIDYDLEL